MCCLCPLRKCCYCLSLRIGCFIIGAYDLILNLIIIIFVRDARVILFERGMTVCHCVGCSMLLLGALVKSTVLLAFYLITNVGNTIISTYSIIMSIHNLSPTSWRVLVTSAIILTTSWYNWLVVYSHFRIISTHTTENV